MFDSESRNIEILKWCIDNNLTGISANIEPVDEESPQAQLVRFRAELEYMDHINEVILQNTKDGIEPVPDQERSEAEQEAFRAQVNAQNAQNKAHYEYHKAEYEALEAAFKARVDAGEDPHVAWIHAQAQAQANYESRGHDPAEVAKAQQEQDLGVRDGKRKLPSIRIIDGVCEHLEPRKRSKEED